MIIWRFPEMGVPPKSFILMGCSIINQPFWIAPSMEAPIYEKISRYDLGYPLGFWRLDEAIGCWTVTWWLSYHKISQEFLDFVCCNSPIIWLDDMNLDSHFSWWLIKWSDFKNGWLIKKGCPISGRHQSWSKCSKTGDDLISHCYGVVLSETVCEDKENHRKMVV